MKSFQTFRCCIYHANCWHSNIYEHDKFHVQLCWPLLYNLEAMYREIQVESRSSFLYGL